MNPPFIVFEGTEGSGKSTQMELLVARLRAAGGRVVATREPGGTAIGRQIRSILLDHDNCAILAETEVLLYAADRAQHVREVVRPALARGETVVCDRYLDSTRAYQSAGRGLAIEDVDRLQTFAVGCLLPDLRVLLDLPVELGLGRRLRAGGVNRLDAERRSFHDRVRTAYRAFAEADPEGWVVIGAAGDRDVVARHVAAAVSRRLGDRFPGLMLDIEAR